MRVVFDTNVLVAGLLSPAGPPGEIVRMVSSGELTLCLDARVLREYAEVLRRPRFGFPEEPVAVLLDFLAHSGEMTASSPLPEPLPDPDDEPFLQVAIAGRAAYLVTGNLAHFPENLRCEIKVVSPGAFLSIFVREQKRGKR